MLILQSTEASDLEIERLARTRADEAEWDSYVDHNPRASVYHLAAFRGFIEEVTGHTAHYMLVRSGGRIKGVLPLVELKSRLFGHYFVSLPYFNHCGILADDPAALNMLAQAASEAVVASGATHVELRHFGPISGLDWHFKSAKDELILDLPNTADGLMAQLKPKVRGRIRRPQREGVTARVGGIELLDSFYPVFAQNMRDLGTPVYGKGFFARFLERFADRTWVVLCEWHGMAIAAGILIAWRDTVEIPWASSLRERKDVSANMLLYWTALSFAIEKEFRRFDFGRSTRGGGTWNFKSQWGAKPFALHWHYFLNGLEVIPELNPDNAKYRFAINVWRRLPLFVTNRLGPGIVRNLP